jgi:hypothetical protein
LNQVAWGEKAAGTNLPTTCDIVSSQTCARRKWRAFLCSGLARQTYVLRRYLLRLPAQMTRALVTTLGNIDDASDENQNPAW